jgi:hypothetical protein
MTRWMIGLLDAQVAAARARGDFDNLSGHGKPLELDDLTGLDAEQRLEALLLRSVGEVAPEVALIRSIRAKRESISQGDAGPERAATEAALRAQVRELGLALKARRTR